MPHRSFPLDILELHSQHSANIRRTDASGSNSLHLSQYFQLNKRVKMGNCGSTEVSGTKEERELSKAIDRQLRSQRKQDDRIIKLLLLGPFSFLFLHFSKNLKIFIEFLFKMIFTIRQVFALKRLKSILSVRIFIFGNK